MVYIWASSSICAIGTLLTKYLIGCIIEYSKL